ncbi:WecB/TagA/CpsF family glycosyltransferase [bacterium]|nr:WecB/TagA/CpsF family glycosyltransferase [bacterium]
MGRGNIEYPFLNCKLSLLKEKEVLRKICEFIAEGGFHYIVTCDTYSFVVASKDKEFSSIVRGADIVTPDGMGVVLGARLLGLPVKERVAGADIVVKLFPIAEKHGWKLFFLGGAEGIAEKAKENVLKNFPSLQIVGCHNGYFGENEEGKVIEKIKNSDADILIVGMGIPKQEKFIWRNREKLNVKVAIGVGGTLDVLAGKVKRAPHFMRRIGLEWLYRLICQPSKIEKVARIPYFYFLVLRQIFKNISN